VNNYRLKYYIFLDELNEKIIKNIQNLKKRKIDLKLIVSEKILFSILDFVKYSKIPFFIIDNVKLATKHKANGIFLTSKNRSLINITKGSQRIEVIGSAHNQYEYFIKERQGCSTIFLSPIFYNKKYSLNKILHIQKFNLITLNWKKSIGALGGINLKNLKLIKLIRSKSIGIKSLITK
jgi:thiamine-phosphate pyrophosphorylase